MSEKAGKRKQPNPAVKREWARLKARVREAFSFRGEPDFFCSVCYRPIRHATDSKRHLTLPGQTGEIVGSDPHPRECCPICGCSDWVRFSIEVLKKYTDITTADCVTLLLAPSYGLERWLRKNRDNAITTGDASKGRAELQLDVSHLALRNHIYDYVICCHVLEHVRDERAAVHELMRVLKPDGLLLLSMPICIDNEKTLEQSSDSDQENSELFGRSDHMRLYGLDAADRLRSYGLTVREIVADERWQPEIKKYKLIPGDRNFLCTIPQELREEQRV